MYQIYFTILFQPLLNLMVFLYNLIGDFGIAIIVLTVIIRLALVPLSVKSIKSQKALQDLQPKMNEIKNKHKDNKEEQTKALMAFYKDNKISPFASCLPLLIQLPIMIALYKVFLKGLNEENLQHLYAFVARPEHINALFLNFMNLSETNIVLAVLAGLLQFIQAKMIMPKTQKSNKGKGVMGDVSSMMTKQMTYFMPVMTVFIAMSLPSALALYWVATTLFTIGQQYVVVKGNGKSDDKNIKSDGKKDSFGNKEQEKDKVEPTVIKGEEVK